MNALFTRFSTVLLLALSLSAKAQSQDELYGQWVERGLKAAAADSLLQAADCFERALKTSPEDYRNTLVFSNLAHVQETLYWRDGGVDHRLADRALESYTLALARAPEAVPILQSRADFLLRLDRIDKAWADYSAILDIVPANVEARLHRAYIAMRRRQWGEARKDYERLLAAEPTHYEASLGMAVLLQETGRLTEAIDRLNTLVEHHADKAELYSVRAGVYAQNHQEELALLDLDKAIGLAPENPNFVLARAYLHKQQGQVRLALQDFDRAIALGIPAAQLRSDMRGLKR